MISLFEKMEREIGRKNILQTVLPNYITDNLKKEYTLRPYQIEAFQRFILFDSTDFNGKPQKPFHLLYNMATGSGKTLIMAGLILYLFQKGYYNFLFFVNNNNIILKTKDNFLNEKSTKYLFNDKIVINGKRVYVKEVNSFEESDNYNINIKFTTIQQLHIDLNNIKENSVTIDDFRYNKLVLIADEAHHLVKGTKTGNLSGSWENTVKTIHESNNDNILLEFTATIDTETAELIKHYQDKVIYKYDLAAFRKDKYSKEICLIRSMYNEQDRIIQALILNLYRQELAAIKNINLKPVILFKAKKTIKESEQNKLNFHKLIDNLSVPMINHIKQTSSIPIIQKAFSFFEKNNISLQMIVKNIQNNFKPENCLSANNDKEAEQNQILLNTLEDENNPIRAIFAVQKLNEGWDVLNLFDIVRLYEDRDGKNGKPGKTTISEAQLIGRGARYYPFIINAEQDKYIRKYDNDPNCDFKILEELYYHTKEDSRYISELKRALIETGIYEDESDYMIKKLTIKQTFKESDFYKHGLVFFNKKERKNVNNLKTLINSEFNKVNYQHILSSGIGKTTTIFSETESLQNNEAILKGKDIKLTEIPQHIIRYALTLNPFFYFDNLLHYFPDIGSLSNFINKQEYLAGLEITFRGTESRLHQITHSDYLQAINGLLQKIETILKSNLIEYQGSDYIYDYIHNVFKDKEIKIAKNDERSNGQEELISNASWYVYNANYGTSEEKKFVDLFSRCYSDLNKKYDDIYLIRNEREIKIYDNRGRAFEPDFLLFCKPREDKRMTLQIFIEVKGQHLLEHDKWKENFLHEITQQRNTIKINTEIYVITALPFYNYNNEHEFKRLFNAL